jgi:hypothetical protein
MPAGDVFGLDGIFLTKSNPVVVSTIGINSTAAGAGITVVSGVLNATAGIATLTLSTAAGLSTTPFYIGAKIAVSGLSAAGVAYTGYNGTFNVTGFAGTTTVSYATTGYVGGVTASISGQTGLVILVTDTAVTNTTWSTSQTHGWFGGGYATPPGGGAFSRVDRIDFSNDTATANIRGSLSRTKSGVVATGNSNYGWWGGGNPGLSEVERIDFSNDSAATSPRGSLSAARYSVVGNTVANSNYGYFGAGKRGFPAASQVITSAVDRIDFSNDSSTASPRGPLSSARYFSSSTGNSNFGWFAAGNISSPTAVSTVDRIDFSNDLATASPRGPLSSEKRLTGATGNSNYGWFAGGIVSAGPIVSTVDRIDFSNDLTITSVRGSLNTPARSSVTATGNSNYGYFGGGNPSPQRSTVDRIDFSNDLATASIRGPLSAAKYNVGATSGQARSSSVRLQKGGNFGWWGGGGPGPLATVDRIDFSNDSSTASPRGPLSLARSALASTGNSNYGWFGSGDTGSLSSLVDRIDFSNDLATASIRGSMRQDRYVVAATGNSNYGWWGGGNPAEVSTVERINFSNDSATSSPRSPLSSGRYGAAATGNSNYGWFGGGGISPGIPLANKRTTVDRINFSNDFATISQRSPLSVGRQYLAATGNSNYGWFGGGYTQAISQTSIVDRINFSNDLVSVLARGVLSSNTNNGRYFMGATGNSNYGWFGGGSAVPAAQFSIVDRIDFSNDSVTASKRGLLSSVRSGAAATSNSTR